MFKPVKAKNIRDYIAAIPEPRKTEIKALDVLIRKTVPKLKPVFAYNMLGYGMFDYRSKSGRTGTWPVIGLASQKNYISLYLCAVADGKYIAEAHKQEFPKASIGKSCIRFRRLTDIDLRVIVRLLKLAAKKPGFISS